MFEVARTATSVHLPTPLASMSAVGSNERMFEGFGLDPLGGSDRDSCCSLPRFTGSMGAVTVFRLDHGFAARVDAIGRRRCSRARRRLAVANVPLDRGAIGDFNCDQLIIQTVKFDIKVS